MAKHTPGLWVVEQDLVEDGDINVVAASRAASQARRAVEMGRRIVEGR